MIFFGSNFSEINQGKYVFAQLTEFLPRRVFDRIVLKLGKELKIDRTTYEILQILGISLLDKTSVKVLVTNNDYKNVKEPNYKQLSLSLF
jgi:hypothetical protein